MARHLWKVESAYVLLATLSDFTPHRPVGNQSTDAIGKPVIGIGRLVVEYEACFPIGHEIPKTLQIGNDHRAGGCHGLGDRDSERLSFGRKAWIAENIDTPVPFCQANGIEFGRQPLHEAAEGTRIANLVVRPTLTASSFAALRGSPDPKSPVREISAVGKNSGRGYKKADPLLRV